MDTPLLNSIKFNCDVSDAQYWGYYSVCGLLMRYRDLFRSEKGLRPWADIGREEIGAWIGQKESKWPELEQQEFRDLCIGDRKYRPFDVAGINTALTGQGLVYGAGYGMYLKPSFFLAELRSVREISGLTVYTSVKELVRDLFTSPGMLQEKSVFLRLEPLVMLLLYKHSELNTRRITALEDAFAHYGFQHRQLVDSTFERRLEEMATRYAEVLLAHELAEAAEDVPEWKEILALAAGERLVEHYLRAIKDLLADTSEQGPYKKIIDTRDFGALGLSIALTEGFRKALYPEIKDAYDAFSRDRDWMVMEQARKAGYERFLAERNGIVLLFRGRNGTEEVMKAIKGKMQKA